MIARDHVGRDRPWRTAEAKHGDTRRQRRFDKLNRLKDRVKHMVIDSIAERRDCRGLIKRLELRALTGREAHLSSERVRHNQNVGKQDRGVETEAPDRLQRHLRGKL